VYGLHSAKVPAAYTVIDQAGRVHYFCDTDCLREHFDKKADEARQAAEYLADHASGRGYRLDGSPV
jgi:hypothetical protein